jgi:hypothetical protein
LIDQNLLSTVVQAFTMRYSIILTSLAAVAIAAPMEMKDMNNMANMKQATDMAAAKMMGTPFSLLLGLI